CPKLPPRQSHRRTQREPLQTHKRVCRGSPFCPNTREDAIGYHPAEREQAFCAHRCVQFQVSPAPHSRFVSPLERTESPIPSHSRYDNFVSPEELLLRPRYSDD